MYITREVQKRVSDPLVLELQAVLTCLTWVLGPELNSQSSKSSSQLAVSIALRIVFSLNTMERILVRVRKPKHREKRDPYILAMRWK